MDFSQICFEHLTKSDNPQDPNLKFEICIHGIYAQGILPQILYLGRSFHFIKCRKLCLIGKLPRFDIKQKLRPRYS